jgi:hypothetical protein
MLSGSKSIQNISAKQIAQELSVFHGERRYFKGEVLRWRFHFRHRKRDISNIKSSADAIVTIVLIDS